MRKKSTRLRGSKRMKEQGYKVSQVWMDEKEFAVIKAGAKQARLPLATFLRRAGFVAGGGSPADFNVR